MLRLFLFLNASELTSNFLAQTLGNTIDIRKNYRSRRFQPTGAAGCPPASSSATASYTECRTTDSISSRRRGSTDRVCSWTTVAMASRRRFSSMTSTRCMTRCTMNSSNPSGRGDGFASTAVDRCAVPALVAVPAIPEGARAPGGKGTDGAAGGNEAARCPVIPPPGAIELPRAGAGGTVTGVGSGARTPPVPSRGTAAGGDAALPACTTSVSVGMKRGGGLGGGFVIRTPSAPDRGESGHSRAARSSASAHAHAGDPPRHASPPLR